MDFHAIRGGWPPIGHRAGCSATVQRTSGAFNFSARLTPQIRADPVGAQ